MCIFLLSSFQHTPYVFLFQSHVPMFFCFMISGNFLHNDAPLIKSKIGFCLLPCLFVVFPLQRKK